MASFEESLVEDIERVFLSRLDGGPRWFRKNWRDTSSVLDDHLDRVKESGFSHPDGLRVQKEDGTISVYVEVAVLEPPNDHWNRIK